MAECPVAISPDLPQSTLTLNLVSAAASNSLATNLSNLHLTSNGSDGNCDTKHTVVTSPKHAPSPLDNFLRLGLSPVKPEDIIDDDDSSKNVAGNDPMPTQSLHYQHTSGFPHCHSVVVTHPSSSPMLVDEPELKRMQVELPPAESPSMPSLLKLDVTHVLDGLYLSDFNSLSAARLRRLGVTFVVNATREVPLVENADETVEFMKLGVDDIPTENIGRFFDECADRIHGVRTSGGVALVHCALGISRSVSICLAYLVKYEGRTLRQAYFEVKKKRPIIRPNDGFWRQLIAFEVKTSGRATVKLNIYPMGVIPDVYRGAPRTSTMRTFSHFR